MFEYVCAPFLLILENIHDDLKHSCRISFLCLFVRNVPQKFKKTKTLMAIDIKEMLALFEFLNDIAIRVLKVLKLKNALSHFYYTTCQFISMESFQSNIFA